MITPRSAKSGIHAGEASMTSSVSDFAMCSVTDLVKICGNGASTSLTTSPPFARLARCMTGESSCCMTGGSSRCPRRTSRSLRSARTCERLTRLGREETQRARCDRDLRRRVLDDLCVDAEASHERRPANVPLVELLEERRLAHLFQFGQLGGDGGSRLDLEVDDDLRAERLLQAHEPA